jgi:hypothetical protein
VIVPITPVDSRQLIPIVCCLWAVPNPRIYFYHEFDRWLDRSILLYRLQPATLSIQVDNESKKVRFVTSICVNEFDVHRQRLARN